MSVITWKDCWDADASFINKTIDELADYILDNMNSKQFKEVQTTPLETIFNFRSNDENTPAEGIEKILRQKAQDKIGSYEFQYRRTEEEKGSIVNHCVKQAVLKAEKTARTKMTVNHFLEQKPL